MKMFLTRIGFGSQAIITGDTTQIDLPKHIHSGLLHATDVLHHVKGIAFTHFETKDIVRHSLVQHIINAYDDFESKSL
jgi:phosphate starvation-inducible PhoH-like protein